MSSVAAAGETLDTREGGEAAEFGEIAESGETVTLVAAAADTEATGASDETAPASLAVSAAPPPPASLDSQAAVLAPGEETFVSRRAVDYVPLVYGAANTDGRIVVIATADSWVQVRGPGGELLLTRVMHGGDRYLVPDRDDLTMLTGNAGALEIVVDGTPIAPVGEVGAVRRDISLNADRMLAENTPTP